MTLFTFFTFFYVLFHTSIYLVRTPQNATIATVIVLRNINATKTPPTTIKIKLIRCDSIFPPTIITTDYNDHDYENDESVRTFLGPDQESNIFLVSIQIDEPPVHQLMVPDTGSSLMFVKSTSCIGCEGTTVQLYDPSASSTYERVSWNSNYCKKVRGSTNGFGCNPMRQCSFKNSYSGGRIIVEGDIGTEKLRFITYDQGITTIPDAVVGCTTSYENSSTSTTSGVLGLAYDKISILNKMVTPKFSYCVGSIFDGDYKYNHIILEKGAKMLGHSTPLRVIRFGCYFLTLEGTSVRGNNSI